VGLIYAGRMELATRYAALALVTPADAKTAMRVGRLQDDLAVLLAEMVETVTGLSMGAAVRPEIADLVRHPVRLLRSGLVALPPIDRSPDQQPPSSRWADVPTSPARAHGAVQVWTGLVVSAATSAQAMRAQGHHMSGVQRWTALGEVAALAEVLAVTRSDLLTEFLPAGGRDARARQAAAALAVEAREVVRLAGDPAEPSGPTWSPIYPSRRIVPVSTLAALPRAVENAGRLLARGDASITDVLSLTRVLAQADRGAVAVLRTADSAHEGPNARLAALLRAHADELAVSVTQSRANLASLTPGSAAVLAQGREIGASGLPRLQAASRSSDEARAVLPDVTAYAAATATMTVALRDAAALAVAEHRVAVRDRSEDSPPAVAASGQLRRRTPCASPGRRRRDRASCRDRGHHRCAGPGSGAGRSRVHGSAAACARAPPDRAPP
jgi:hypothetical protein